ncbi:hypothetical protein EJ06DRAFT_557136 [Trichodelitschia bisporula]|uniref:Uncharacterized protein n=1 Tax=Trichodelitschia bisporula TaxID=703511 RepID=A0A6G1HVX9_9PEZI|nr:hypothetical protein EJ06DRAFT_557136 [Trichodelitschia bisporula]
MGSFAPLITALPLLLLLAQPGSCIPAQHKPHTLLPRQTVPQITFTILPNITSLSQRHAAACYEAPDFIAQPKRYYREGNSVVATCWTKPAAFEWGRQACEENDQLWWQTSEKCWVPDFALQPPEDLNTPNDKRAQLNFCPPPLHQTGALWPEYGGVSYCYTCANLDCAARKIQHRGGHIELNCWRHGAKALGDDVWWRIKEEDCWVPQQVFDPMTLQGNGLECARGA